MKKRPYGISYDGAPPARYLVRYTHIDFHNQDLNIENNQVGTSQLVTSYFQIKQETAGDISKDKDKKIQKEFNFKHQQQNYDEKQGKINNEAIKRQLNYVGKFISFDEDQRQFISGIQNQPAIRLTKDIERNKNNFCLKLSQYEDTPLLERIPIKTHKKHSYHKVHRNISKQKWQRRILKCHKLIQNVDIHIQRHTLNINRNTINIEAQSILKLFMQMMNSQQQLQGQQTNREFIKWTNIMEVYYIYLHLFLQQLDEVYKIWVLDFASFGLAANIFYGWLQQYRPPNQPNTMNSSLKKFLLQMFLIFCQWCFHNNLINQYVTRKTKGFKVHIDT